MRREPHVRFREGLGVRSPRATRLSERKYLHLLDLRRYPTKALACHASAR